MCGLGFITSNTGATSHQSSPLTFTVRRCLFSLDLALLFLSDPGPHDNFNVDVNTPLYFSQLACLSVECNPRFCVCDVRMAMWCPGWFTSSTSPRVGCTDVNVVSDARSVENGTPATCFGTGKPLRQ